MSASSEAVRLQLELRSALANGSGMRRRRGSRASDASVAFAKLWSHSWLTLDVTVRAIGRNKRGHDDEDGVSFLPPIEAKAVHDLAVTQTHVLPHSSDHDSRWRGQYI